MPPEGTSGKNLVADPSEAGMRLDLFVTRHIADASRSAVQRWIRDGLVTLDGKPVRASAAVASGAVVHVARPTTRPSPLEAEPLPLDILYEDDDLIVVDKPAGMVVHPAPGHDRGTVVNALLHRLPQLRGVGGVARPGIVHRLDKGTSGVMVVAKHDAAHRILSRQFHDREVRKSYLALVWGRPAAGLRLDAPIGRDPHERKKMSVRSRRSRQASTTIVQVEPLGDVSLVRAEIGTGRTHQIRVHLAGAHHSVVGDSLYGGTRRKLPPALAAVGRLDRPFLHAHRLELRHPADGRLMVFESPLPEALDRLLTALRNRSV
jgi:23S rRNA pseudouridine1911/1915/1917 synthase